MIKEAYCSKEVSELLKEKGFNERCRAFWKSWLDKNTLYECDGSQLFDYCYNEMLLKDYTFEDKKNIAAPTHQMAMAWLREKGIFVEISVSIDLNGDYHYSYSILDKACKYIRKGYTSFDWKYEDAVEAALTYSLENLI